MAVWALTHIFLEEQMNASEQCLADVIQLNNRRGSHSGVIQTLSLWILELILINYVKIEKVTELIYG
jgi:hypothetical protein